MKAQTLFLLLCSQLPLAAPALADAVDSRVSAVTVYADRARVTRTAEIALERQPTTFSLDALPGWIDESSVRVGLQPGDAGEILGVKVRRTYLARPTDEEFRAAQEAVLEIQDQLTALDDEKAILESEVQHVERLRAFSVDKLPTETAMRRVEPAEYQEALDFATETLRRVAEARRDLARRRRELEPELGARQRRLAELQQRAQLEQRAIEVTAAAASGAPATATLEVTYMLPGATWEPAHELRADRAAQRVTLASVAEVRQTTGEDWTDAAITLSTQRSDQTLRIPEIEALHLGGGRSLSRWVASSRESFGAASESYARLNQAYFASQNADLEGRLAYAENQKAQLDNARRVTAIFQSLEQRGTTAHFEALGQNTVRSDGSAARLPIGKVELSASQRILAAPELSLNAVRVLDLSNPGELPLLPGKVSLYVNGAFLGHTETDFIGPGEAFQLFLGVADHIKLGRSLDRRQSDLSRRGARTRLSVAFLVEVENLASHEESVELHDRVPVSQTDQIRVTNVHIAPEAEPDASGLLSWPLRLAAREKRQLRIEYTIEYPTDLPSTTESVEGVADELRLKLQELETSVQK